MISHLIQSSGFDVQFVSHLKCAHDYQPIGGVNANPLSSANTTDIAEDSAITNEGSIFSLVSFYSSIETTFLPQIFCFDVQGQK